MKKISFFLLLLLLPLSGIQAQRQGEVNYLAGAVPMVDGYVQFDADYNVPSKSRQAILEAVQSYVQAELVEGPDQLPQARITELTPDRGILAASIEEYMYFKRTNWQIHRVKFYYQLVAKAEDGKIRLSMRRLHYRYDPEVTAGDFDDDRRAEQWITDEAALTKNGTKLARISGKFRKHTIDRKREIFAGIAKAVAAEMKKTVIVIEE